MTAAAQTSRRLAVSGAALVVMLVGAGAALYGAAGPAGNSGACPADKTVLDRVRPLAKGEVAGLTVPETSRKLPDLAFKGPNGEAMTLAAFKGRTVLLNLWATWCVPCREEMPALDRLQAELGGPAFEVLAINIDTRNLDKPQAWLNEAGIRRLARYADPEAKVFQDLKQAGKVVGLPTSILVDGAGCEIAILNGPAEWSSREAVAFVGAALRR